MQNAITVCHLSKKFTKNNKDHFAIKNINFNVRSGEIFGIMGQSGAGKSTLLRCLSTLEVPTEGSITIQGQNICQLKEKDLRNFRKNLGMIFQHFNLLSSRTVAENIALPWS
jgi:D-methionine transport system ATP-binding protein